MVLWVWISGLGRIPSESERKFRSMKEEEDLFFWVWVENIGTGWNGMEWNGIYRCVLL